MLLREQKPKSAPTREALKREAYYDPNDYYLLVVPAMEDADRLGFMPRKRSFAFLNAARLTTPAAFIHTAAHELGHGAFHLQHIFDRFPDLRPGATDNLMDYGDSTTLYKYQWDNIHDPESNFSLFDEEGEGASVVHTSADTTRKGMAILIAFPTMNPEIPDNQRIARWWEETFSDGDHRMNVGHAAIVIIREDGFTRYFDFGRYTRNDISQPRPNNTGAVRSSSTISSLAVPNWDFNSSDSLNLNNILNVLRNSLLLNSYGTIIGALQKKLNYDSMLSYAINTESAGYVNFGGYTSSCAIGNATYCAKFARCTAKAGGMGFWPFVFTGQGNVESAQGPLITLP